MDSLSAAINYVISSIAGLRALDPPTTLVRASLLGYYASGDGGGGIFWWNSTDATADNGGTVIAPNAGGIGRWNLVYDRIVRVDQFGAKGDGVTDDAATLATVATAVGSSNAEIHFSPRKTYVIGSAGLLVSNKTDVHFVGHHAKILGGAKSNLLSLTGAGGNCLIKFDTCTRCSWSGFEMDGGGFAHDLVSLNTCTDCAVKDNTGTNCGAQALLNSFGGTRTSFIGNTVFTSVGAGVAGIRSGNYSASQIETDVLFANNEITSMSSDGIVCSSVGGRVVGNKASGCFSGIIFGGANGFSSKNVTIVGNTFRSNTAHGIQSDVSYTTIADVPVGIVIANNVCELNNGSGIFGVYLNGATINGNVCINNNADAVGNAYGIQCDEISETSITGNYCCDTRAGGSRTQVDGINIVANTGNNNIKNTAIVGNICRNNTNAGITVQQNSTFTVDSTTINGNVCNDNSARGIIIAESTAGKITRSSVVGNVCKNNTTNDLRVDSLDAAIADNLYSTESNVSAFVFTDQDTTPSVLGARKLFKCTNSVGTTITGFDDGILGQVIKIWFSNGNTTINTGGHFSLKGGANLAPVPSGAFIEFTQTSGNFWTETGRNF